MLIMELIHLLLLQTLLPQAAATGTGCGPNTIKLCSWNYKSLHNKSWRRTFSNRIKDEIGELLGSRGKEFGTVTSRKRRCGWFDGVLSKTNN